MKIKTKWQYNEWLKNREPKNREALPLGRKNKTKSGKKKEAITL